jgi:hypothetical protein
MCLRKYPQYNAHHHRHQRTVLDLPAQHEWHRATQTHHRRTQELPGYTCDTNAVFVHLLDEQLFQAIIVCWLFELEAQVSCWFTDALQVPPR